MSSTDLLSQDEIDALLHGVDSGRVDTEPPPAAPGEARSFDFASQERIDFRRQSCFEVALLTIIHSRYSSLLI